MIPSNDTLQTWAENLGIHFHNPSLLKKAFIHPSYLKENPQEKEDNNRLEFLGDSVLSIVVSEYLYQLYPNYDEGKLTRLRSNLVCRETLFSIAKTIGVDSCLFLGRGLSLNSKNKKKILADALESLLGLYYLDSRLDKAREFILPLIQKELEVLHPNLSPEIDSKSTLQFLVQKQSQIIPSYRTRDSIGPDHSKTFYVDVLIEDQIVGSGSGSTKKEAQQFAASQALQTLGYPQKRLQ